MNNSTLFTEQPEGARITLTPDWFVLTDGTSGAVPELTAGRKLANSARAAVFIDHETPCGSEKVGNLQRRLIRFAQENNCALFNGYGISCQIMLDKFIKLGDLVLHCGDFGSIYAAAGALALKVTPEQLAEALVTGGIETTVPGAITLELSGALRAPACGKDAALTALGLLDAAQGKTLYVDGAEALSGSERIAFFQMLSACGCAAVLPGKGGAVAARLDLNAVVPTVSAANDLSHPRPAAELVGQKITSVFIGGCSAGRIEDIRAVAALVKGKKVMRTVRTIVAFATSEVYIQAANEGLITTLLDAGVVVMNQGCSACYAHSQGLVDDKDLVLSAGSRECPNCAGQGSAPTWLCAPLTAIAAAVAGQIE